MGLIVFLDFFFQRVIRGATLTYKLKGVEEYSDLLDDVAAESLRYSCAGLPRCFSYINPLLESYYTIRGDRSEDKKRKNCSEGEETIKNDEKISYEYASTDILLLQQFLLQIMTMNDRQS